MNHSTMIFFKFLFEFLLWLPLCLTVAWKCKLINTFLSLDTFDEEISIIETERKYENYLFCKWQCSSSSPNLVSYLQPTPHSLSPVIQLDHPWNCSPNHLSSACLHSRDSFLQGESSFGRVLAFPFSCHSLLLSTFLLHNYLTSAGLRHMSPT